VTDEEKWAEITKRRLESLDKCTFKYWCIGPILEIGYGNFTGRWFVWAAYGMREWRFPRAKARRHA
jgi:hypothetical protein